MESREPILIGDWMRRMGLINEDGLVDHDLLCALFYDDSLKSRKNEEDAENDP